MVLRLNDPEVIKHNWQTAIADWRSGDPSLLFFLLRGGSSIPDFARCFLADALEGKEKRPRKRPPSPRYRPLSDFGRESLILMDYQRLHSLYTLQNTLREPGEVSGGTPKEKALEAVAAKYNTTPDKVSHIVHPRRGKKSRIKPP